MAIWVLLVVLAQIKNQILVSNLYPIISGIEYQEKLFSELQKTNDQRFFDIKNELYSILKNNEDIVNVTKEIESFLSRFNVPINSNHLIQVDLLKKTTECYLSKNIKDKISEATDVLSYLTPSNRGNSTFEKFKMAFYERYENAFVPLSKVMDTDIGLGYKNSVSTFWQAYQLSESDKIIKSLKLRLFTDSIKSNSLVIELKEEDLAIIKKQVKPKPLPESYSFIGNLYFKENGETEVLYKSAGGPSAINLMGRFGHLNPEINDLCRALADEEKENYKNTILAEIVHLPQGRMGNILTRPHYRDFEIVYLSHSTLPTKQQISTNDLYIGMVNFRIVLFSKKLNKEIIPRLSNAHNYYFDSLPIYHFLCDLQSQNLTSSIFWTWDDLDTQEFLPRITYKNIILSPARWNIETSVFKNISFNSEEGKFHKILKEKFLPSKFLISQGDNELYIDIETELGAKTFLSFCKKYSRIMIEEFFYDSSNTINGFTSEVIIPYSKIKPTKYTGVENISLTDPSMRIFNPLSQWIYLKLYTGKKFADKLLIEVIPDLLKELKDEQIISQWFFVRYSDPKNHIRLRFKLCSLEKRELLFKTLSNYLNDYTYSDIIWDIQIDTYKRELERYGYDTIIECENWFHFNSELVLKLLPIFKDINENDQLIYIMLCINQILNQFQLTLSEKLSFSENQSAMYNKEFNVTENKSVRLKLNNDYRKYTSHIEQVMSLYSSSENALIEIIQNLWIENERKAIPEINIILNKYIEPSKRLEILASFIHMFINRMFNANQRNKEMVLYYFLLKYYTSMSAKSKIQTNTIFNAKKSLKNQSI